MAKQLTIKEIARLAGVSPGTVDRILHNRGRVSGESLEKVRRVLEENNYKQNIHTSAISLKTEYRIVVCVPDSGDGDYWGSVRYGITRALEEYSDIDLSCTFIPYDQFNADSSGSAFQAVLEQKCDAVIIGPTFENETRILCSALAERHTPYVFVDADVEGTSPVAVITTDQNACGRLLGKLMTMMCPKDSRMALFHINRKGGLHSLNSVVREKAMKDFIRLSGRSSALIETSIQISHDSCAEGIRSFIGTNPDIQVAAVLNSRGHIIADALKDCGRPDIRTLAFDVTYNNRRCIKDGSLTALICQRPETQGFSAVRSVIEYLIYGSTVQKSTMPVDLVLKENIDLYSEDTSGTRSR